MAYLGLGLEFRPSEILLDFEAAAIESLRFAFPTAILIGCFFHFGQCLFRKLCDVGLREHYGKDEKLKHWFNLCVALAFIPPDKVEHIFVECILDEAQYDEYPQLEKFSDYMLETWLEGSKSFPITLWNQFKNHDKRVNVTGFWYNTAFYKMPRQMVEL
jgi:hypothetical protein